MSDKEWESLCDGCGRCCLNKFEDDDGIIEYTDVACKLLDLQTCRCRNYKDRHKIIKDCVVLKPRNLKRMTCLPPTCAYRLLYEKKPLFWWHHLISGSRESVHRAGISVKGRAISEETLSDEEVEQRLVSWPTSIRARRVKKRRSQH